MSLTEKKNPLMTILETLIRHNDLINVLAAGMRDYSIILNDVLPKCDMCHEQPSTVKHKNNNDVLCDRCCAKECIVNKDNMQLYVDIDNAESIRRVLTHLEALKTIKPQEH